MKSGNTLLAPLLLLLTLLTGVCPQRPREVFVRAGEMVALLCPHHRGSDRGDTKLVWTGHTTQDMDLENMSSVDWRRKGVLVHGRSLVILTASVNHQGNYSCSPGNTSRQLWFRLTVYQPQNREYEEKNLYSMICYTQESCTLKCPDVNVPPANTLNITSTGTRWRKEGESLPQADYFSSVEERDHGVYTCTRSYLYHDQSYNMTFALLLDVQPKKQFGHSKILSPGDDNVFDVDLGQTVVIDCKAVMSSEFDEVFWLINWDSFVDINDSAPVFYNYTSDSDAEGVKMTASLVIRTVSEEDLLKRYTCKLESSSDAASFVTVTLAQKASPFSSSSLALSIVIVLLVIVVTVVLYVKLKMDMALFLRDSLGCFHSHAGRKSYDAFLMSYKSDVGLNKHDRKRLKSVLEERFGYRLCDHDILPGKALDCMEQSGTVVLVPTSSDPGSGLLSAVQAALVERQTRLVFIRTEATEVSRSGSLPEALQLLEEAGDCVTWKGSMSPSASFWKQLRYHLPSPQRAPRPQTATQDDHCSNV